MPQIGLISSPWQPGDLVTAPHKHTQKKKKKKNTLSMPNNRHIQNPISKPVVSFSFIYIYKQSSHNDKKANNK
jgi:hypothetical protein